MMLAKVKIAWLIVALVACTQVRAQKQPNKAAYSYIPTTTTLNKKVMFGYQGWHATPGDGAGIGVWRHWFGRNPVASNANFDAWPYMAEYPKADLEDTGMQYPDGSKAALYSSYKYSTVDVHFKWMAQNGLDGVFQQRFISDIRQAGGKKHFNQVVRNVKTASEKYKRVYCIMYDISGAGSNWKQTLLADWKYLVDSLEVTTGSSYLHHTKRPLLAIWGMGFQHNSFATAAQADSLIEWFHLNAPKKYQATIMAGVNDDWREHEAAWKQVYDKVDVISPWSVGRYSSNAGADNFAAQKIVPDAAYCAPKNIGYMPVIFPGFSWANLRRGRSPFNQIPRNGGEFYWRQAYNALNAGVNMVYIAMFDEVDEGTAMYKIAQNAAEKPANASFLSTDQDGIKLPADWYLRLAGSTSNIIRGKAKNTAAIPIKPGAE